jgi:lipid-binding SYLF domain-containing protein
MAGENQDGFKGANCDQAQPTWKDPLRVHTAVANVGPQIGWRLINL